MDVDEQKTAEETAEELASNQQSDTEIDETFDDEKEAAIRRKQRLEQHSQPGTPVEQLGQVLLGLKTFYNVFRNLEAIPKDLKLNMLDKILDYHIQFNKDLIIFFRNLVEDATYKKLFAYIVTLGGQDLLNCNISNSSLKITLETALAKESNDFKKLILIFLYSELRLKNYEGHLLDFLGATKSPAAIEMIYFQVSDMMVQYDREEIPDSLKNVYKQSFLALLKLKKGNVGQAEIVRQYNKALAQKTQEHLQDWVLRQ